MSKRENMKESITDVHNVANFSLRREVWVDTKGQYMKESNTLAVCANIKQLQGVISLNITG